MQVTTSLPLYNKQWAHYAIDATIKAPGGIQQVRVREVLVDGSVSTVTQWIPRSEVVSKIEKGFVFKTITETFPGAEKWNIGALVVIEVVRGIKYIKTVRDGTAVDNLDNL